MDKEELLRLVREKRESRRDMYYPKDVTGTEIYIPVGKNQTRALWYAADKKEAPVYFDIHGGGFVYGSPEYDDRFCRRVCDQLKIHVMSIEYPLAPEHPFPCDKETTYAAICYMVEQARQFGIDTRRMLIGGHSAGGNIATVVCMMAKEKKKFTFLAQILDYPPLDLVTPGTEKLQVEGVLSPRSSQIFNESYCGGQDPRDVYCSPLYATTEQLSGLPDALVITCEKDPLRDEGEAYMKKLMAAGVEVQGKRFYGAAHGFTMQDTDTAREGQKYMIDFMRRKLEAC